MSEKKNDRSYENSCQSLRVQQLDTFSVVPEGDLFNKCSTKTIPDSELEGIVLNLINFIQEKLN